MLYGVVSAGRIGLDKGAQKFIAGAVVDWTPEQEQFFLQRAPQNFVLLSKGFEAHFDHNMATKFLPKGDCFHLLADQNALVKWQQEYMARIKAANDAAAEAAKKKKSKSSDGE